MARTLTTTVRLAALLACAASILLLAAGAFDPAVGWTLAMTCGFVAYAARLLAPARPVAIEDQGAARPPDLRVITGLKGQRELDRAA